jgi:hypothetical protein
MSVPIQRFVVKAYPTVDHPDLHPFHLHTICVFIGEGDYDQAQARAEKELWKRKWRIVRYLDKSTLIEERVKAFGGEVWDAYLLAAKGRILIKSESNDNILPKSFSMAIPAFDEKTVDRAIEKAGGHRLTKEEANNQHTLNADYVLGNWIIELKELEEERLLKTGHQNALATLFEKYCCDDHMEIDYDALSPEDQKLFVKSACSPVRHALEKASKQIAATKAHLGNVQAKGAVIILNNGFGSLQPELLPRIADQLAKRHSQIDLVICLSQYFITNGFDNVVNFHMDPVTLPDSSIEAFYDAIHGEQTALMTKAIMTHPDEMENPLKPMCPIIFERNGKRYRFVPGIPPNSMFQEPDPDAQI